MTESRKPLPTDWDDDDIPAWSDAQFDRAELRVAGKILRPADGTLTKPGRPKSNQPKQQVTLRLDQAVLDAFRATGPGWQSRINAQLRKALGL
ncbi:BrnA antitoxin family protein [Sphingobium yanoikuyae]|uniref:BrnA antitoxin family protein n=1 Tax=Sphingobium yanoikuyae TaxID=13690 RepID=A0A6M4GBG0_SPHYA|nr:BrnA antitoxin family protein [Sphingobium yanoikuyae]QJR04569.1 BrnA antitoxin family protein [Sphingobium yanoikuyae]